MQQSIQLITYKTIKYAYVRAELTPMESTYHLYIIKVNDILGSRKQEENKNFYIVLQVSLNGSMNVYIGVNGEKELLFTINGGESFDDEIVLNSKYDNEKRVYIILESVGKCVDGDFEFEYN